MSNIFTKKFSAEEKADIKEKFTEVIKEVHSMEYNHSKQIQDKAGKFTFSFTCSSRL